MVADGPGGSGCPVSGWRWQDDAATASFMDEKHLGRRVFGIHEIRFDGLSDLLLRARGASVFDVGCNRGHVAWDFAANGARMVHGCDVHAPSVQCVRMWFSEHPHVTSKFEVVDLTGGRQVLQKAFGDLQYDIVLLIGVQHKLRRVMSDTALSDLLRSLGQRALTYFGWNGYSEDLPQMEDALQDSGLVLVHWSELALSGRPACIWKRR